MIISHNFECGLLEYGEKGTENNFPIFERCPNYNCISQGNLHRNGYYWRYGIDDKDVFFYTNLSDKMLSL